MKQNLWQWLYFRLFLFNSLLEQMQIRFLDVRGKDKFSVLYLLFSCMNANCNKYVTGQEAKYIFRGENMHLS